MKKLKQLAKDVLKEWKEQDPGPKRWFKSYGDKYTEYEKSTNKSLKENKTKPFQPGDGWSNDFDYIGMLKYGAQTVYEMGLETLQKLYDSFEDVNYHSENKYLGYAISEMEDPGQDANQAQENIERDLEDFRNACLKTLKDMKVKWKPSTMTGKSLAMSMQGRANLRNKLAKQNIPGYDKHLEPKVKGRR